MFEIKEAFNRDGFVIPPLALGAAILARAQAATDRILLADESNNRDAIPNPHLPKSHPSGVKEGGAEIFRVMTSPAILTSLQALIGLDIVLWSTALFAKRASVGKKVPWHQDGHYWPMRPLKGSCTVWVALELTDYENGCVQFVRGSHVSGILNHRLKEDEIVDVSDQEITADLFCKNDLVPAILTPGQMSIHDVHVIHGSLPNASGRRRIGLAAQYMPAASYFDRDNGPVAGVMTATGQQLYRQRPIWLVSGKNTNPANDFRIGHEGLEELDEIAEEVRLKQLRTPPDQTDFIPSGR